MHNTYSGVDFISDLSLPIIVNRSLNGVQHIFTSSICIMESLTFNNAMATLPEPTNDFQTIPNNSLKCWVFKQQKLKITNMTYENMKLVQTQPKKQTHTRSSNNFVNMFYGCALTTYQLEGGGARVVPFHINTFSGRVEYKHWDIHPRHVLDNLNGRTLSINWKGGANCQLPTSKQPKPTMKHTKPHHTKPLQTKTYHETKPNQTISYHAPPNQTILHHAIPLTFSLGSTWSYHIYNNENSK